MAPKNRVDGFGRVIAGFWLLALAWVPAARGFTLLDIAWPDGDVRMELQLQSGGPAISGLSDGATSWNVVAQRSLELWNGQLHGTRFTAVANSNAAKQAGNRLNNVFWSADVYGEKFDQYTLGVTLIDSTEEDPGTAIETDVIFNTQAQGGWDSYRGALKLAGATDFRRVALHEFGHVLGLDHPDQDGQSVTALMNSHVSDVDGFMADDLDGITYLYGPQSAPTITLQPVEQVISPGKSFSFKVIAKGRGPMTYQWQKDGVAAGPLESSYGYVRTSDSTAHVSASMAATVDLGAYRVAVANRYGVSYSSVANLSFGDGVIRVPGDQTVAEGQTATFAVETTKDCTATFQWQRMTNQGYTDIPGAKSATLTVPNVLASDTGEYLVRIHSSAGEYGASARLNLKLGFANGPVSQGVAFGGSVTLSAEVVGKPAFSLPRSIVLGPAGELYVGDGRLRRVEADGTISTVVSSVPGGEVLARDVDGNFYGTASNRSMLYKRFASGPTVLFGGQEHLSGWNKAGPIDRVAYGSITGLACGTDGNVYVADRGSHVVIKISPRGFASILAGEARATWPPDTPLDGTGSAARFGDLAGLAIDRGGNLYVVDQSDSYGLVRKISPAGVVTTLAGNSNAKDTVADGTGSSAAFWRPSAIAVDASGNLYVADNGTIRKISSGGVVTTLAGKANTFGRDDGSGSDARFSNEVSGLCVATDGTIYVADTSNYLIRKVSVTGVVTTRAGEPGKSGTVDGRPLNYQWLFKGAPIPGATGPTLTIPSVQLADTGEYALRISNDVGTVTSAPATIGIKPTVTSQPASAAAMPGEQVVLSVSATSPTGRPLTYQWKNAWTDADVPGATSPTLTISKLDPASATSYYVVISDGQFTTKSQPASVQIALQIIQAPTSGSYQDGVKLKLAVVVDSSEEPLFSTPSAVVRDRAGTLFVADSSNYVVRKIDATGASSVVAGRPREFGYVDGARDQARFASLGAMVLDDAGNLYVADAGNCAIRRVATDGSVSTLAGELQQVGSVDGTGSAARFRVPQGLVRSAQGDFFVCDTDNHTIRKITAAGVVTTVAGKAGEYGYADGTGPAARFHSPWAIALDGNGNLYVTDAGNLIRRITPEGVVSTWAGKSGVTGVTNGPIAEATFYGLRGICSDGAGGFFVCDGSLIRTINAAGVVATFAGDTFSEEQRLYAPNGLCLGPGGIVFVADPGRNVIRKVGLDSVATFAGRLDSYTGSYREGTLTQYQWRFNGADIPGATDNLVYVTGNFQSPQTGEYSVAVRNRYGSLTTTARVADIATGPWNVVFDFATRTLAVGETVTYRVSAAGTGELSYQWLKNGAPIAGATQPVLTLARVTAVDAGSYAAKVSNTLGNVTTVAAVLNVSQAGAPTITTQPASNTWTESGFAVTLTVVASGSGVLHYQWLKNGAEIAGATSATFTLSHALESDGGYYTVRVTNDAGQMVSGVAYVYVNRAQMPVFTYPLQSRSVAAGQEVTLDAGVAFINSYITYQWKKDGVDLPGANGSTLKFSPVTLADQGAYTVVVTTDAGSITSTPAILTITGADAYAGTYLGPLSGSRGYWALRVKTDGTAMFIAHLTVRGSVILQPLVVRSDGTFLQRGTERVVDTLASAAALRSGEVGTVQALPSDFELSGRISGQQVTGSLSLPGESFTGIRDTGSDTVRSGYYHGAAVGPAAGDLDVIVGPSGAMFAIVSTSDLFASVLAIIPPDGRYNGYASGGGQFALAINSGTQTVAATLTPAGASAPINFAGLSDTTQSTARLVNIATRAYGSTGNRVTIGGFVVSGSASKRVLVRAVGPSLTAQGISVAQAMTDPMIEVHDASHGNVVIATNDNWGDNANAGEITTTASTVGATALLGSDTKSSALLRDLAPGVYTFVVKGKDDSSGIVLLEVYNADATASGTSFVNIATRAYATTGNGVTIGGFVITGNAPKRVLLRAVGPTLSHQGLGVAEVLADPVMELHDASHGNMTIATNDNWGANANAAAITTTGARIGATPFDASDTKSAALLLTLQPGVYSFIASGKNNSSGIVLVEVYDAD